MTAAPSNPLSLREDESGVVMALLAISAFLLVILGIGFTIDLPTSHSNAVKTQNALDVGGVHALYGLTSYSSSANAAFDNADAIMRNEYAPQLSGFYSNGLIAGANTQHSIWIPRLGTANPHSGTLSDLFKFYSCTSGSRDNCAELDDADVARARYQPFLDQVFDVGGIDDFRNAVMVYAVTQPYNYLAILPQRSTESLAIPRISNAMTYILIDPAFSLDPVSGENYQRVFGVTQWSNGDTDGFMWPVAALTRPSGDGTLLFPQPKEVSDLGAPYSNGNSEWASGGFPSLLWANLFGNDPTTGVEFSPNNDTNVPLGINTSTKEEIYRFYAQTCDTLPFFHFKSAAVNLIDRLMQSSAYNPTTMVGLTGYRSNAATPELHVVPIHPAVTNGSGFAAHALPTDFPLSASTTENSYLHSGKSSVFTGLVDSRDLDVSETSSSPSGLNRPELAYCRGLYGNNGGSGNWPTPALGFRAPQDLSGNPADEATLAHTVDTRQVRDTSSAVNWIDDSASAAHDYSLDYSGARSGAGGINESTRNVVGNLAMRLQNPRLEWVSPPTPAPLSASAPASPPDTLENLSRWRRPIDRTTSGEYAANTYSTVGRGFRYLPTSIRTACGLVDDATSSYNSDAVYGRYRPINQKAVVVHAFGVYSDSGRADAGLADEAAVMTDLRGALKDCLCGNPEMSVYFAFLPLTAADRAQVQSALSIIQEFESDNNYRCAGQTSPLGSPCDTGRASAVFTFIYDYQSSRFSTWDGTTPIADSADNSIAKLRAAEAYNKEIYELISKLLLEYVYAS